MKMTMIIIIQFSTILRGSAILFFSLGILNVSGTILDYSKGGTALTGLQRPFSLPRLDSSKITFNTLYVNIYM